MAKSFSFHFAGFTGKFGARLNGYLDRPPGAGPPPFRWLVTEVSGVRPEFPLHPTEHVRDPRGDSPRYRELVPGSLNRPVGLFGCSTFPFSFLGDLEDILLLS